MNTRGNKAGRNFLRSFFLENPNEPGVRMMILNEKMQLPPKVSESIAQIMKFVSQRCKMNPQELKWRREEKAERHGKGAERHR